MLELLGNVPEANLAHLADLRRRAPTRSTPRRSDRPEVCFVDGEHTNPACQRDAEFCRRRDTGPRTHRVPRCWHRLPGGRCIRRPLTSERVPHRTAYLPDSIFVIELGDLKLLDDPAVVLNRCLAAGTGVLWLLESNDRYRALLHARRARVSAPTALASTRLLSPVSSAPVESRGRARSTRFLPAMRIASRETQRCCRYRLSMGESHLVPQAAGLSVQMNTKIDPVGDARFLDLDPFRPARTRSPHGIAEAVLPPWSDRPRPMRRAAEARPSSGVQRDLTGCANDRLIAPRRFPRTSPSPDQSPLARLPPPSSRN